MIRKNLINCKLFWEKRSANVIVRECMDNLHTHPEVCPQCGCKEDLPIHACYKRILIDLVDGRPVKTTLYIYRLICRSCPRPATHAILPDPIIPYCRHSLRFILRVLAEHVLRLRPVEKICETFQISVRTFYRWQRLFDEHRKEWHHLLASSVNSLKASLLDIIQSTPYCVPASSFIQRTGFSLLQSHRNPVSVPKKGIPASGSP